MNARCHLIIRSIYLSRYKTSQLEKIRSNQDPLKEDTVRTRYEDICFRDGIRYLA